jgi:hypothetical protein
LSVSLCVSHSAGELESAEEEESTLVVALLFDAVKCIGPCLCVYLFCVCGEVFVMDLQKEKGKKKKGKR